jgi:hypothetical protein
MKDKIKCAFCDWSTFKWRTNKKGERKSGYVRLKEHCLLKHDEEPTVRAMLNLDIIDN